MKNYGLHGFDGIFIKLESVKSVKSVVKLKIKSLTIK